ncbi:MFS transporter [Ciceribacter lividus]|nr:MFS transporter [Ciceribacter lividus]
MLTSLSIIFRHPPVRVSALAIFLFGFSGAATSPYMSLIGIRELGLSDHAYSVLIFVAALVNVSASITAGILVDRLGHYRRPMIATSLFGVAGFAMVYAFPAVPVFVLAMLVFIPVFGSVNSLIFANIRAVSAGMAARDLIAVNSVVRAVLSLSWVLVPGLVGALLVGAPSMLPSFLFASLACGGCFLIFAFMLPRGAKGEGRAPPRHAAFLASLGEIASGKVLPRVLAIALISSMLHVNGVVLPLVVTGKARGTTVDVGTIVGIVAFLEIVFILFWGWVERRTSARFAITASACVYAVYLVFLGLADAPRDVYVLTLVAGLGAAGIISVPITYLQDLIAERAGLGSSLIAVNVFLSGGLSSLAFALGTAISDYAGTAILGAFVGLCGIVLLRLLDRSGTAALREADDEGT